MKKKYGVYEVTRVSYHPTYPTEKKFILMSVDDLYSAVGRAALLYQEHPDRVYLVFAYEWEKVDIPVISFGSL